jgi:asparagine synthetase B (glutamine-hydrolysing)
VCGFFFANFKLSSEEVQLSSKFVSKRGPDEFSYRIINNQTFCHHLLHITGEKTTQPIYSENAVLVYNGEVYDFENENKFPSDGHLILEAYSSDGIHGIKQLCAEFAGVIASNQKICVFRDTFGTKPLYYAQDHRGFAFASYKSQLSLLGFEKILSFPNNLVRELNMNGEIITEDPITQFDIQQTKDTFEEWEHAFSRAIEKRTANKSVKYFIGLSSGYDSGLIASELNKQNVDYHSYSILAAEHEKTLYQRNDNVPKGKLIALDEQTYEKQKQHLAETCESYRSPPRQTRPKGYDLHQDKGAVGTGIICEMAKEDGCRVYLSGQGSDEIICDYGFDGKKAKGFLHSTFSGRFPHNLESIFPWENFFGGTQQEFLAKDENVGGSYGIESRYPFLDIDVVQEFLWLKPELKNSHYKAPIYNLLLERNFPIAPNGIDGKVGFRANHFSH